VANPNYLFTDTLAAALASLGICHAAITPGSRNTPLAVAFADNDEITHSVHIDERSAAFFALGAAKQSGFPAVLICTSGTAAAEYAPAVHEASVAGVPLIVLTADRPPELRDVAAPQSINQNQLYGGAPRWFHELATPDPALLPYVARVAAQAWGESVATRPGPVHVNVPLRDPLAPIDREPPPIQHAPRVEPGLMVASHTALLAMAEAVEGRRVLIVAGPAATPPLGVLELAEALGAPVVADPLSNLRNGHPHVISTGDTLARVGMLDSKLRPDVVIRLGAPPTSKAMGLWQAHNPGTTQIVIDPTGWREPQPVTPLMVAADGEATALALLDHAGTSVPWLDQWREAEDRTQSAFASLPFPSEPGAARSTIAALSSDAILWVASSMPIRDVDSFWAGRADPPTLLANRGANGIDGFVSSALGTAAVANRPTYALAGDLSLLHDATALITANRLGLDLTLVVINNDGGGIFHFLPQADYPDYFDELLVVPHGQDIAAIVEGIGGNHRRVEQRDELTDAVATPPKGLQVIEIVTDRQENHDLHTRLFDEAKKNLMEG